MALRWKQVGVLCCATLLGWPGVHAHARATEAMHISTSELPPFAMQRPGEPGALLEMVEELVRRTGVQAHIEFVPWRRAIFLSTTRARSAIFPLTRSPERETRYRWLAPLYREHFLFLGFKDGKFDLAHPARNKQRRIATLRGSLMIEHLRAAGYVNIVEAASVEEAVRFLQRGIVEAACGDRETMRKALGGQIDARYATSATLRETSTWLGGSLDFSAADAERFEAAMKEMVADGTHARILKKYRLAPLH